MKVLHIEDSISVRLALMRAMPQVEFVGADTVAFALAKLASERFDAILLDIGMGDADGLSSLNHLDEIKKFSDAPILILSGNDKVAEMDRAIEGGAVAYLTKRLFPSPETLLQIFITLYCEIKKRRMTWTEK